MIVDRGMLPMPSQDESLDIKLGQFTLIYMSRFACAFHTAVLQMFIPNICANYVVAPICILSEQCNYVLFSLYVHLIN